MSIFLSLEYGNNSMACWPGELKVEAFWVVVPRTTDRIDKEELN